MNEIIRKIVDSTFFPVEPRRLYWEKELFFSHEGNMVLCNDWVAIVATETNYVFTMATKNYTIFTNRRAYELGMNIAKDVLKIDEYSDIICPAVSIGNNCASVEYNLCGRLQMNQPEVMNGWVPIVTIQNSYNKTKPLTYILGFRHIEYGFNVLFPELSVKSKSTHDVGIAKMVSEIWQQIKEKRKMIDAFVGYFKSILKELIGTPIAPTDFLPLFCKIQNIKKKNNLPEMTITHLVNTLNFVKKKTEVYSKDYGYNGYSMLMVVADYIENLNPEKRRLVATEQMNLGKWVEEFLEESSKEDYSPYVYIGKDAYDTASWFGTLVQ